MISLWCFCVLILYLVFHSLVKISFRYVVITQGEGVAYRGRILVQLTTKLEDKVDKTVDSIHSDDILVAQVW